jgi:hypothetical protein
MRSSMRRAAPHLVALGVVLLAATAASAQTHWPSLFRYTVSLSTDDNAAYQVSASLSGDIGDDFEAKLEGWWIGGRGDDHGFLGDAYVGYDHSPVYVAAGRKYVPFGPAGVLVSPGLEGGELRLGVGPATVQVITGSLAFTPGTGTTRFTFGGLQAPADEDVTAVRVGAPLTRPDARIPVTIGGNWIDLMDDDGWSVDGTVGLNEWLTLYGEGADFGDENAHAYGFRLSDAQLRADGKAWIFVFYHRHIDVGFVPAEAGASVYFEGQEGFVGSLYYQMHPLRAIGVYADNEEAIVTWFQNFPL